MIYLASPYTHPQPHIMQSRYVQTVHAVANLIAQGIHIYSPIVHFHMVAMMRDLPKDFSFWMDLSYKMIDRADSVAVLKLEGWEQSIGILQETEYAVRKGLPVTYYEESIAWPA